MFSSKTTTIIIQLSISHHADIKTQLLNLHTIWDYALRNKSVLKQTYIIEIIKNSGIFNSYIQSRFLLLWKWNKTLFYILFRDLKTNVPSTLKTKQLKITFKHA